MCRLGIFCDLWKNTSLHATLEKNLLSCCVALYILPTSACNARLVTPMSPMHRPSYWLQGKHLLALSMDCSLQCHLVKRKETLYCRCPRKGCHAVVSVRDKSFFAKSKLSLQTTLKLQCRHSRKRRQGHRDSRNRLVLRAVFSGRTIGVPGKIMEIDESKFGKRRGRSVEGLLLEFVWRRIFEDRDLFEIILEHIAEQYPFFTKILLFNCFILFILLLLYV